MIRASEATRGEVPIRLRRRRRHSAAAMRRAALAIAADGRDLDLDRGGVRVRHRFRRRAVENGARVRGTRADATTPTVRKNEGDDDYDDDDARYAREGWYDEFARASDGVDSGARTMSYDEYVEREVAKLELSLIESVESASDERARCARRSMRSRTTFRAISRESRTRERWR